MSSRPPLHHPPQRYYRTGQQQHPQAPLSSIVAVDQPTLRSAPGQSAASARLQDEARLRRYQRILNEKELKMRVRSSTRNEDQSETDGTGTCTDNDNDAMLAYLQRRGGSADPPPPHTTVSWQAPPTFNDVTQADDGYHTHHTAGVSQSTPHQGVWTGAHEGRGSTSEQTYRAGTSITDAPRHHHKRHAPAGSSSRSCEDAAHYWEHQYNAMRSKCATVSRRLVEAVQGAHEREMNLVRLWGREHAEAHAELDASLATIEVALRHALPQSLGALFDLEPERNPSTGQSQIHHSNANDSTSSAAIGQHQRVAQAYRIVAMAHAVSAQRKLDHAAALKASDRLASQLVPVLQQVSDAARMLFHTLHSGGSAEPTRTPSVRARKRSEGSSAVAQDTRPPLGGSNEEPPRPARSSKNPPPPQATTQGGGHSFADIRNYIPLDSTPSPKPKAPLPREPSPGAATHDDAFAVLRERLAANRLGSHATTTAGASSDDDAARRPRRHTSRGSPSTASTQFELHYVQPLQHEGREHRGTGRTGSSSSNDLGATATGRRRSASTGGNPPQPSSAAAASPKTRPSSVVASSSSPLAAAAKPTAETPVVCSATVQAACDVLRDIYHTLEGVVATAQEAGCGSGGGGDPMDELLSSFQVDLQHLTRSTLHQLKTMSHRMLQQAAASSSRGATTAAPAMGELPAGAAPPPQPTQHHNHHSSMSTVDVAFTDDDRAFSATGGAGDRSFQLDIKEDDEEQNHAGSSMDASDEEELRMVHPQHDHTGNQCRPQTHANRRTIAFIPAPESTPPRGGNGDGWRGDAGTDPDGRHTTMVPTNPSSANSSVVTGEGHRRRVVISPLLDE